MLELGRVRGVYVRMRPGTFPPYVHSMGFALTTLRVILVQAKRQPDDTMDPGLPKAKTGALISPIKLRVNCFKEAMAAKHVVGGSSGWDESTDFNSWASAQTFKVGDELEFKYSSGLHSVVELGDESAFKSCDVAGSSLKSYNSGSDSIKLTKTGTRYFACGTSGHCDQGMKVKITTVAADAPSTTTSTTPSSQGGTGTDSAASASSGATSTPQLQFLCAFILIASSLAFLVLLV